MILDEKNQIIYKDRDPLPNQNNYVFTLRNPISVLIIFNRKLSEELFKNFEVVNFDDFNEELSGSDEMDMLSDDT